MEWISFYRNKIKLIDTLALLEILILKYIQHYIAIQSNYIDFEHNSIDWTLN